MATAKEIKRLQKWGEDDEVISKLMKQNMKQPSILGTDYFHPSNANWSWEIGLVRIDGIVYEVLTQFGVVKGGRPIYMPEYDKEWLEENKK